MYQKKNFNGEVVWIKSEQAGRTITVNVTVQNIALYVVGIYAPTRRNEKEQQCYFRALRESINDLDTSLPFSICGDMNVHMSRDDTDNVRYRDTGV